MASVNVFNVTPQSLQFAVNNGPRLQLSPANQQGPAAGTSVPLGNQAGQGQFGLGQNIVVVISMEGQAVGRVGFPSDMRPSDMMLFVARDGWWMVDQGGGVAGSGSLDR